MREIKTGQIKKMLDTEKEYFRLKVFSHSGQLKLWATVRKCLESKKTTGDATILLLLIMSKAQKRLSD